MHINELKRAKDRYTTDELLGFSPRANYADRVIAVY
jgi:hypothetical protein